MTVAAQLNTSPADSLPQFAIEAEALAQPPAIPVSEPDQALHQQPEVNKAETPVREFIRKKMPPWAYGLSSIFHMITTGILYFSKFSDTTRKNLAETATRFTKFVNSLIYSDLAVDAFKNNFSFDFLGRIAEPIMNLFVDLNHYHLFRGISSALNQLHTINLPRMKKHMNLTDNFVANIEASIDFFKEAWLEGGMANLFKWDIPKFRKDLFGGENDKGHTLAVASHVQMLVSGLALLNGNRRNFLNRFLGIFRNLSGVLADIGLLFEKDSSARWVGTFYLLHAVGDTIKRFVRNPQTQDLIDNLIMPFYNGGLYCFGLMTRRQVDGTYKFNEPKAAALAA
ncbi:MAG: hypothetical protein OXU45_03630 [Candidatus Melainabacteria bacterium]|nr:hypothetical protein [Candidatus Melainabacteria bacterium]